MATGRSNFYEEYNRLFTFYPAFENGQDAIFLARKGYIAARLNEHGGGEAVVLCAFCGVKYEPHQERLQHKKECTYIRNNIPICTHDIRTVRRRMVRNGLPS
ncbi:hypothetical protein BaRGS_00002801 [Batillaria attramentaria]|uniref:Uncharacterized protein n=1 Tax=Batillaria attramentaria TaxID=370345 RepID=A0ABD0M3Z4_9CAEN